MKSKCNICIHREVDAWNKPCVECMAHMGFERPEFDEEIGTTETVPSDKVDDVN